MLLNLECDQAYNHGFGVEEVKGRWQRGPTCSWHQLRGGCVECPAVDELVSDTPLKERGNQLTEYRYGDDGSWSAISIRVGSPQQWVDVMASTVSSETWVVGAAGCQSGSKFLWFRPSLAPISFHVESHYICISPIVIHLCWMVFTLFI